MSKIKGLMFTSVFALVAMPTCAFATEAPAASEDSDKVADIIVTARRRDESLQTVPVAVTAMDARELQARGVVDIRQVAQASPSTFVTTTTSTRNSPAISIRGQVQGDSLITLDPAVGTYVDDVYVARPMGVLSELLDVASVEVLKGPQGTLYGRNTTGGAFKITTAKPDTRVTSGYARVSYGNYNTFGAQAALNLPLIADVLAARYAVSYNKHDGYTKSYLLARGRSVGNNVTTNPLAVDTPALLIDTDNRDTLSQRLSFRLTPGDRLTIDLMGEMVRAYDNGSAFYNLRGDVATSAAGLGTFTVSPQHTADFYSLQTDVYPLSKLDTRAVRASLEYEATDNLTTRLIYGHRWVRSDSSLNNDGNVLSASVANAGAFFPGAVSGNGSYISQGGKQDSIEAQLLGKAADGKVNWLIGGFWFKETGYDFQNQVPSNSTVIPPITDPSDPTVIPRRGDGTNKSWSVFANVDADLTERLSVTGGIRYTKDDKVLLGTNRSGTTGACLFTVPTTTIPGVTVDAPNCLVTSLTNSDFISFLGNISYKFSDDVFGYFKVSNGYRSGGGQARALNNASAQPFLPETVLDFEAGLKTKLLGGRATLNLAAFRTHRKQIQFTEVALFPGNLRTTYVVNAGSGDYTGIEAELRAQLGAGFSVEASASYYEEKRTAFIDPVSCATLNICTAVPVIGQKPFIGSFSLVYDNNIGIGRLNGRIDVNKIPQFYSDQRSTAFATTAPAPQFASLPGYALVNARLGITLDSNVSISVFGKNVLKKEYFRAGLISGGNYPASFGDPRTFGFEVGYKF